MMEQIKRENAVIYARFSSAGQRDESIEGQLRECHAFAERYNLNVIGEYIDKALTGTSDKTRRLKCAVRRFNSDGTIRWVKG